MAWWHWPELRVVVVDKDLEHREQDSKDKRDGEFNTSNDLVNVN